MMAVAAIGRAKRPRQSRHRPLVRHFDTTYEQTVAQRDVLAAIDGLVFDANPVQRLIALDSNDHEFCARVYDETVVNRGAPGIDHVDIPRAPGVGGRTGFLETGLIVGKRVRARRCSFHILYLVVSVCFVGDLPANTL